MRYGENSRGGLEVGTEFFPFLKMVARATGGFISV